MPTQRRFGPVSMVSEQRWTNDAAPGKVRETGNQLVIFFTPVTDQLTDVLTPLGKVRSMLNQIYRGQPSPVHSADSA